MPVYCYKCSDCGANFEARHSMSFEGQECQSCKSKNVFKVPSLSVIDKKIYNTAKAPGAVVDKYISDAKRDIKKEKESLKNRTL